MSICLFTAGRQKQSASVAGADLQSDRIGRAGAGQRQNHRVVRQDQRPPPPPPPQKDVVVVRVIVVVVVAIRSWRWWRRRRRPGQAFAVAVLVVVVLQQRLAYWPVFGRRAPSPAADLAGHHHGPVQFQTVRVMRAAAGRRSGRRRRSGRSEHPHSHQPGRDHTQGHAHRGGRGRRSVQQQGERVESQVARGRQTGGWWQVQVVVVARAAAIVVAAQAVAVRVRVRVRHLGGRADGCRGLPVAAPPPAPSAGVCHAPAPPSPAPPHGCARVAADEPVLPAGGRDRATTAVAVS